VASEAGSTGAGSTIDKGEQAQEGKEDEPILPDSPSVRIYNMSDINNGHIDIEAIGTRFRCAGDLVYPVRI
jgi:hypothetical protein